MLTDKIHNKYFYLGNKEIMEEYKVGFLCSRKVPAEKILKIYDWAIKQREKGICVVSGFHSKIEKDVFHYLCKGTQPIILVLARGLYKNWSNDFKRLIEKDKLLVITKFDESVNRITSKTTLQRNKFIMKFVDELTIGYVNKEGLLSKQIAEYSNKDNSKIKFI